VTVRAFHVRDENGKPTAGSGTIGERMTDDRGVYRMYGLLPGTYIVSAGGMTRFFGGYGTGAHDQDAPTYAPSATRDTAQEVVVRSGDEATADIQYRGEPGHAISGTVSGFPARARRGGFQRVSHSYGCKNANDADGFAGLVLQ